MARVDVSWSCLKGKDTLSGEVAVKLSLPPYLKGVYSERKEFVPKGSKFFPFRIENKQNHRNYLPC